jgi:uncharacterized membrane protein
MLSKEERRFIRSWEEQRQGGRRAYYLLYIIAGSVILTIGVSFVMAMIRFALPKNLWAIPIISLLIAVFLTHYSWVKNERKFKVLIRRETEAAN